MLLEKLSVTLDAEEVAWVRRKATETASTVSAVLSETVRQQRRLEALEALLAELGTSDITPADVVAILGEWGRPPASPGAPRTPTG